MHQVEAVKSLITSQLPGYTMIVATRLDSSIALGPGRDTNLPFRASVDSHLHQILSDFGIQHQMLFPDVRDVLLDSLHIEILQKLEHL
jgi:hypothetical protein